MTETTAASQTRDRILAVMEELRSIRAELAATGSTPHAALHDSIKSAEKSLTYDTSLPTYLAELP